MRQVSVAAPPKRRRQSTKTPEVMPAVGASVISPGEQVILPNDEEEAKPELMQDKRFKLTYLVGGLQTQTSVKRATQQT